MKIAAGVLMALMLLYGNEVERIERIVEDMTKLRQEYQGCRAELASMKTPYVSQSDEQVEMLQQKIKRYEADMERMTREHAADEKKAASLRHSLNDTKVKKRKPQASPAAGEEKFSEKRSQLNKISDARDQKPCIESNPFPKLLMKTEYQAMKVDAASR